MKIPHLVLVAATAALGSWACSSGEVASPALETPAPAQAPPAAAPDASSTTPAPEAEAGVKAPASINALSADLDPEVAKLLAEAGLDPMNLPRFDEIEHLDRAKIRAVMRTFTTSLGVDCKFCHYEEHSAEQAVAKRMWDDFVLGLQRKDGKALYCDSCHQGKRQFLDREHGENLRAVMRGTFVEPLARRDGQEHSCGTCHGTPFKPDFLTTWRVRESDN